MIDLDADLGLSGRVLDAMAVRARAVLHNVANQNTPGFKRYVVSFEDELRRVTEDGGDPRAVLPTVTRDTSGPAHQNNVSVVEEMALFDKVRLVYELFSQRVGSRITKLNRAIQAQ